MNLLEQLNDFLNNKDKKEEYISAEEFKEIFILGFAKQLQLDVEKFFNFNLIDTNDGNCQIVATLKQNTETTCHVLNEFFLKKNLPIVKNMFGIPDVVNVHNIGTGIAELRNENN